MHQLADVHVIVHEMASLVRSSFGPLGAETLLFCPPEPPILTSSGYTILHYADMTKSYSAHPIKTLLMQRIRAIYREVGDGITQYILMLDLILQSIEMSRAWSSQFVALKGTLATSYCNLFDSLAVHTPIVFDPTSRQASTELQSAARNIARTSLSGMFSPDTVDFIADFTIDWLFKTVTASANAVPKCAADIRVYTSCLLREAKEALLQLAMGPLDGSRIARPDEYFLRLSSLRNPTFMDTSPASNYRFILLNGSLEFGDASTVELNVQSSSDYIASLEWPVRRVCDFLSDLKWSHHVNLLLCTQAAPDHASSRRLRQAWNTRRCGISWLTSVFDSIDESKHIGVVTSPLRQLRLGGSSLLHLQALKMRAGDGQVIVPQALLRGQSKGICKQYYYAVKKSLRVLASWFEDCSGCSTSLTVRSLGGGQAPEQLLARAFAQDKTPVAALLAHALMGTFATLQASVASSTGSTKPSAVNRLQALGFLQDNAFHGCVVESEQRYGANLIKVHKARPDAFGICSLACPAAKTTR
ncbi:hypothetical protein LEN26_009345 [Aphanomyces euteiches]|nr:hypothetical protein AeMF1_009352 [Aphanomyces euteiches]KAH9126867.1 hypothetical protein LEN26_009345 [Aphanomyces euteiches]KAH9197828.1 hypothetical protein AeNC1_000195 [Aphanomyces euteiches]